jgi:hypothetical protein
VDLPYGSYNIGIFNGYQKNQEAWKNNSRVKKLKVKGDGKPLCFVNLRDLMGCQTFDLPSEELFSVYRFEIVEVYPGLKWKDTAISEIASLGCCFNLITTIKLISQEIPISEMNQGAVLSTIDIKTGQLSQSRVTKSTTQRHRTLLQVRTESHSVELTPYHPLFVENHGLISLYELRKIKGYTSYNEMLNHIKVLVWDYSSNESTYEAIQGIEIMHGDFKTVSIMQLEQGNTFIANGFVTSTY